MVSGCALATIPRRARLRMSAAGVAYLSIAGSAAPGQSPTYVIVRPAAPARARRYRAAATGGATNGNRLARKLGTRRSRSATRGHEHTTVASSPRMASASRHAAAMSSSPQLAGTAAVYPAARQAFASCTAVAGRAASTVSAPRMTIAGTDGAARPPDDGTAGTPFGVGERSPGFGGSGGGSGKIGSGVLGGAE